MEISLATSSAPGRPNEDLVLAGENFTVVLDGVTSPADVRTGCIHDPVWLVRTLGSALAERLIQVSDASLTTLLADSIGAVRGSHEKTCDLTDPESPSSTVAILRERSHRLEYLVLCDSAVVLAGPSGGLTEVITDNRTAAMRGLTRAEVASRRNIPGGFWVASTDPRAAEHALTGSVDTSELGSVVACTDGVSRLVDYFGYSWQEVLDLATAGPLGDVLRAVRACEAPGKPPGAGKQYDDATVALCRFA